MNIIRFTSADGRMYHGEDRGDGMANVVDIGIPHTGSTRLEVRPTSEARPIHKLLAPIDPPNILCAGRNYPGSGVSSDDELELFMKPTTAIAHPGDAIIMPRRDEEIDPLLACEGELAIIIGRLARHAREVNALDHILGYTLANDITARRWQTKDGPPRWMRGKGFDTFCPLGPAIVTLDEISDLNGLEVITRINGEVHRRGSIVQLIRSIPQLIAEISANITLLPGTVILTGAPGLVDGARDAPLAIGDRIEVQCDAIGTLANVINCQ